MRLRNCFAEPLLLTFIFLLASASLLLSCSSTVEKPEVSSDRYKTTVSDFYMSLSAAETDQGVFASEKMQEVVDRYPAEAAAWANLSVYAMRQGNFDRATTHMQKALDNTGEDAEILFLAGILESRKGNVEQSIDYLQQSIRHDSTNLKARYNLLEELEREDPDENAEEIREQLDAILADKPDNLLVLLEKVRVGARWQDENVYETALDELERLSTNWPDEIEEQFIDQKNAILEKEGENISFELSFLRNNLNQLDQFQADRLEVQFPSSQVGFLVSEFRWLPNAEQRAAPADSSLKFTESDKKPGAVQLYQPVALANDNRASTITVSNGRAIINDETELAFPARKNEQLSPDAVTTLDYDYNFMNDLVFTGSQGIRLYRQNEDSTFADITDSLGLSENIINQSYSGVWVHDFDLDGDLDLILARYNDDPVVLRNNGDGSFEVRSPFGFEGQLQDFLWADFDQDGDQDAVFLSEDGRVEIWLNQRAGNFEQDTSLSVDSDVQALAYGDINADGTFDILTLHQDMVKRSNFNIQEGQWEYDELLKFEEPFNDTNSNPRMFIADFDNNGALDLLVSNSEKGQLWLNNEKISLSNNAINAAKNIAGIADVNGDNRLDLLGVDEQNNAFTFINSGNQNYKARVISPRAAGRSGDQRINSFGIGGEIESRTGLQYVKQPIDQPWIHIGLGSYDEAEVVRIVWPNGTMQAEFAELGYDDQIQNEQILKGSCPWVLTHNGERIEFVTDFLWRTALGLKINAQGKADVIHSIDWVKIERDQLKPKDGYYDVRITADLWETHFFDHVSLMAVDHPEDAEVFVDERFTLPAPEQKLYPMKEIYPVASAYDQDRKEVTDIIAEKDGNYLDSFELTPYQGLAEDHYVEVTLGDEIPDGEKLKLLASGWVYPTDTSINIAISQGNYDPPHGIRVEVPDGDGGWKVAHENIGFPTGKNKTVLVDLDDVFESDTERKVRLYTNMEIYWDQIQVGVQEDDMELQTHEIDAKDANLRYRGYSKLIQKERFKPTEADYSEISGTTPKWRDLIGFYTRFGDVKELTQEIDDRYVIMNAGDELVFKFPALESPKEGWTRSFVLIGDGWVKDGDFNTGFSKTVLPLPYHGMEDYSKEPGTLEEDPVYQKHKQDWTNYHTRYVTPHNFNTALQFQK